MTEQLYPGERHARRRATLPEEAVTDALLPCPFCGGEAQRITIGEDEPNNAGGDVICCKSCQASSHVEFGYKENLVSRWNTRAMRAATQPTAMPEEELVEQFARAMFDEWPLTAVSPALAEQSGQEVGAKLTWEAVLEMGGDHNGLLRLARGAVKAHQRLSAMPEEEVMRDALVKELWEALDPAAASISRLSPDYLGELVRKAWVEWAFKQPNPKPSWLLPYRDLSEADKQADRDIGVALARIGATTFANEHRFLFKRISDALSTAARIEQLEAEIARLREGLAAFVAWDEAEKAARPFDEDNGAGFYARIDLCDAAFTQARALLKGQGK